MKQGGHGMNEKNLVEKAAEKAVKKQKKKLRKKVKRVLRLTLLGVFLLGTGYFLGVHHRVIEGMVKGRKPPKAPRGHCFYKV